MNWQSFDHKAFVIERQAVLIAQAIEGFRQMGRGFIEIDMGAAQRIGRQGWEYQAAYICAAGVEQALSATPELKRLITIYNPAREIVCFIHVPGNGAFSFRLQAAINFETTFAQNAELDEQRALVQAAVFSASGKKAH